MATVLGLSAFFHDSAAALVVDGQLVAAAQEERFSRAKGDAAFPSQAARFCLEYAGLPANQLDAVVFYENPALKLERVWQAFAEQSPRGWNAFRQAMPDWFQCKLRFAEITRRELRLPRRTSVHTCLHHLAHAASAYYPSPFSSATVLTVDGVGEWTTAAIFNATDNVLEPLVEQRYPHSLGLFYTALSTYCGFEANSGESKLMGLAAYAQPLFHELLLQELMSLNQDGSIQLNARYFDFNHPTRMTTPALDKLLSCRPRQSSEPLEEVHRQLAASMQSVAELVIITMARYAIQVTGKPELCLAGGVALNCAANGRLAQTPEVSKLWVPPCANDSGGAIGAALWYENQLHPDRARTIQSQGDLYSGAALGPEFTTSDCEQAIQAAGIATQKFDDAEQLCEHVANRLANGQVIGWFQGRMEFGPRALGCRSILADPRRRETRDRVNEMVKHREAFRPFAPAALADQAAEYFDIPASQPDLPFMTTTVVVKTPEQLQAVTHVDGTARLQTVDLGRNGLFAKLLSQFQSRTGLPILLNTSFNDRDEPIVCSPQDALTTARNTQLDALVLGPFVIERMPEGTRHTGRSPLPAPVSFAQLKVATQCLLAMLGTWLILDEPWRWIVGLVLLVTGAVLISRRTVASRLLHWQFQASYPVRWTFSLVSYALVYGLLICPLGIWRRIRGKRLWQQHGWHAFESLPTYLEKQSFDVGSHLPWWLELAWRFHVDKKWWMIPLLLACALIALAAQLGTAVSPWIYTLW